VAAKHSFSTGAVLQSGDVFHKTAAAIAGVLPQARLYKSTPRQFRLRDLIEAHLRASEKSHERNLPSAFDRDHHVVGAHIIGGIKTASKWVHAYASF